MIVTGDAAGVAEEFGSIQAAVDAAPPAGATIRLGPGTFREKLHIDKPGIRLEGAGRDLCRIAWDDAAGKPFGGGDGPSPLTGTFRSYTAYFGGEDFSACDLTMENDAGRGPGIGQALAAYVDSPSARFSRCAFLGHQDTLFLGPLPPSPRIPGSFAGPGEARPRLPTRQLFEDCLVAGDVDFIFGSASALFLRCELRSLGMADGHAGYIAAASTPEGNPGLPSGGFVFVDCELGGDAAPGSVYLGRPWRPFARTAFLRCRMGPHIAAAGWSDWSEEEDRASVGYVEGGNSGPGSSEAARAPWARILTAGEADKAALAAIAAFGAR